MNKVLKWICIVCAAMIVFGVLIAGLGKMLGGSLFSYAVDYTNKQVVSANTNMVEDTISINSVDTIYVNTTSPDVNIILGEKNEVHYILPDYIIPEIKEENGKLSVVTKADVNFRVNMGYVQKMVIDITVDEATLKTLDVKVTSGDVNISDINIKGSITASSGDITINSSIDGEDLDITLTSGACKINDCKFNDVKIGGTSGNLKFYNCENDNMEIKYTSGELYFENCKAKTLKTENTSGDNNIKDCEFESVSHKTTSGEFKADRLTANDINAHSTSGEIRIELVGDENDYNYSLETTSGDIKVGMAKIDGDYERDDGCDKNISANATSGDIVVSFVQNN